MIGCRIGVSTSSPTYAVPTELRNYHSERGVTEEATYGMTSWKDGSDPTLSVLCPLLHAEDPSVAHIGKRAPRRRVCRHL